MMFKLKSMQSPWPNHVIVRGSGFKPTTLQPLNFHAKYTVVGKSQSCTHAQHSIGGLPIGKSLHTVLLKDFFF